MGILLLNILGFGLHSAAYFNPAIDGATHGLNLAVWGTVDVLFEGSMRCLFSILFGAGVVLFTTGDRAKSGILHYRRNFWLLLLGLIDIFALLWTGDILVTYAIAGAILFLVRNKSPRWLLCAFAGMIILLSSHYAVTGLGLGYARDNPGKIGEKVNVDEAQQEIQEIWLDFKKDFSPESTEDELAIRQSSYFDNIKYTVKKSSEIFTFQLPVYTVPDALTMMLLGMALFKMGVLNARRSDGFYIKLMICGMITGLTINLYEVVTVWRSGFDILVGFRYIRPSYHLGRLGMAAFYLGLVMLVCRRGLVLQFTKRLAAVGRMALTNYLSHSLICLFIFTGAGLSLVGELQRWMLYVVVLVIWIFQLWFSPWWLERYKFGPVEWVWRYLTYGVRPAMVK